MSEYNAKNYTEQGGDVIHIGGTLVIEDGASVEGLPGSDPYVLPVASDSELGGVKVGEGLSITNEGVLSADGGEAYQLPVASGNTLGGVKVGSGLSISDGVLSADGGESYELPVASSNTLGGIKVGSGLSISDGVLSADGGSSYELPAASSSRLGGIIVGTGLWTTAAGLLSIDNSVVGVHPQEIVVTGTTADSNINVSFPGGTGRSNLNRPLNSPKIVEYYVRYGGPNGVVCYPVGYGTDKRIYFHGFDDIGDSDPKEYIIGISGDTSGTPVDVVIIRSMSTT